jgi:8-oxo-dGTP diphosphatase
MEPAITTHYGNKLRVRISGLCWDNNHLLLANHRGLGQGDFWSPPGGGLEFGQSAGECLEREFREETGLIISTDRFLFGCEFIRHPLHAIELFFEVSITGGVLQKGDDPELPMIEDVRFMSPDEIIMITPSSLHGIFKLVPTPADLKTLNGFFRI